MTLVDPTSGLGYSFGQKLPSTHMTTIATNQPKAVDGDGGGTWTPSATILLNGASALQLGGKLKYTSRIVTRTQPLAMAARTSFDNWRWDPAPVIGYDWTHNNTAGSTCQHELTTLAHNSVLDRVTVSFKGPAHGASWPVATLAKYALYRVDNAGTATLIGAVVTDASAQAVYETAHTVVIASGTGHVIDLTQYRYIVVVTAETGMNSQVGGIYYGATVGMTITEQAEV